jgi:CheY-like chemotaxis protein
MPGLSGVDLCKIVRSSPDTSLRNLPVIAYTAHAMRQEQELYLSIGFNDILIKPMTRSDLLHTVRKYIL